MPIGLSNGPAFANVDGQRRAKRRAIWLAAPLGSYRYADATARHLRTDCESGSADTEARDFCGHDRGRGDPADTAYDLAALFAASAR